MESAELKEPLLRRIGEDCTCLFIPSSYVLTVTCYGTSYTESFVTAGEARVEHIASMLKDASIAVTGLRAFYGEAMSGAEGAGQGDDASSSSEPCPSQTFFTLISQLAAAVKRAVVENTQASEQVNTTLTMRDNLITMCQAKKEESNRAAAEKRLLAKLSPTLTPHKGLSTECAAATAVAGTVKEVGVSVLSGDRGVAEDVFTLYRVAQEKSTDSLIATFKARMMVLEQQGKWRSNNI